MSDELLVGNDNSIRVRGLKNTDTGSYMNACTTATWELRTAADGGGTQVSSGSMAYVAASNGEWLGGIDDAVSLTVGTEYWLTVVLVESGARYYVNRPFTAVRRRGKTVLN